jgi:hypothetical protein
VYTLDAATLAALRSGSPTMVLRLVALEADGTVRATYDLTRQTIVSGSTFADLRRDVRRSASLDVSGGTPIPRWITTTETVATPGYFDSGYFDSGYFETGRVTTRAVVVETTDQLIDMLPQGAALRVETGVLVDGGPSWVPMVTGYVTAAGTTMRSGIVSLTVESYLSACRQEAGEALVLAAGTPIAPALHTLWDPVLPFIEWNVEAASNDRTLGADVPVLPTDSRLDVGLRLARSVGCEAYDDREGRVVVRVRPDPMTQETARVMSSPIDLYRGYSRPPVNAQPVEVSPGDAEPFYVLEEIDDPASPLHRSRIGLRMAPMIRSDTIPDPDTARALARSWLAGRMLRADELDATEEALHLDLDEGDIVQREETVTRTSGRFVVESISYPLGPGTITTSERAVLPLFMEDE